MKIVRPMIIAGSSLYSPTLTTTNVTTPESGTTDYSSATTYALGDKVTSETNSLSGVTVTIASPAVITWTAHELVVDDMVSFTTSGALPTGLTASCAYFVTSILSADTFTLSLTKGGSNVITSGSQSGTHIGTVYIYKVYQSLQASNTNHHPRRASNSAWWQALSYTNKYKMFDGSVTSQTVFSSISIKVTFSTNSPPNTLALLNIRGSSCVVKIWDSYNATYIYNQTHSLILAGVTPTEKATDLILFDLPETETAAGWIEVALTDADPSLMCAIGAFLFGMAIDAGDTEYGASVGIQDFSIIEANDFGDYDITERAFSKTASFQVMVAKADVKRVYRLLSEQRAQKCLYIGSDDADYTPTAIYGFPDDWKILISYPNHSILNIDIKGLT